MTIWFIIDLFYGKNCIMYGTHWQVKSTLIYLEKWRFYLWFYSIRKRVQNYSTNSVFPSYFSLWTNSGMEIIEQIFGPNQLFSNSDFIHEVSRFVLCLLWNFSVPIEFYNIFKKIKIFLFISTFRKYWEIFSLHYISIFSFLEILFDFIRTGKIDVLGNNRSGFEMLAMCVKKIYIWKELIWFQFLRIDSK